MDINVNVSERYWDDMAARTYQLPNGRYDWKMLERQTDEEEDAYEARKEEASYAAMKTRYDEEEERRERVATTVARIREREEMLAAHVAIVGTDAFVHGGGPSMLIPATESVSARECAAAMKEYKQADLAGRLGSARQGTAEYTSMLDVGISASGRAPAERGVVIEKRMVGLVHETSKERFDVFAASYASWWTGGVPLQYCDEIQLVFAYDGVRPGVMERYAALGLLDTAEQNGARVRAFGGVQRGPLGVCAEIDHADERLDAGHLLLDNIVRFYGHIVPNELRANGASGYAVSGYREVLSRCVVDDGSRGLKGATAFIQILSALEYVHGCRTADNRTHVHAGISPHAIYFNVNGVAFLGHVDGARMVYGAEDVSIPSGCEFAQTVGRVLVGCTRRAIPGELCSRRDDLLSLLFVMLDFMLGVEEMGVSMWDAYQEIPGVRGSAMLVPETFDVIRYLVQMRTAHLEGRRDAGVGAIMQLLGGASVLPVWGVIPYDQVMTLATAIRMMYI